MTAARKRGGNYSGNNRRGGIALPAHAHPLVWQFVWHMNDQRATYAEVAGRSGVGVDTMRFWPTRHQPTVDLFDAALNVLDLELVIRPRGTRDRDIAQLRGAS